MHMTVLSDVLERLPGYLSVSEAARALSVSERSVYDYIEVGKLPGVLVGNIIVVPTEAVACFERRAPGRLRTKTPPWRVPPVGNVAYLTIITVRTRSGQGALLEKRLASMRAGQRHCFPGTAARFIARNQRDPDEIEILLVWRSVVMPPAEVREASLAALKAELEDVLEWETATMKESQVLLHA